MIYANEKSKNPISANCLGSKRRTREVGKQTPMDRQPVAPEHGSSLAVLHHVLGEPPRVSPNARKNSHLHLPTPHHLGDVPALADFKRLLRSNYQQSFRVARTVVLEMNR